MRTSHLSDEEECSLYALGSENIKNLIGIARYWTIVEGKYDLFISKGQGYCAVP